MKKRRALIVIGIVAGAVVIPPLLAPILVSWSEINCRHEFINIKTGQARFSRSLWFIRVSDRIEDTWLSVALDGETVDVAEIEAWHVANTFSPGIGHSPHYSFHNALNQIHQLETIESLLNGSQIKTTPERRRKIAGTILTLWQQSGSYRGANEYIDGLFDEGASLEEESLSAQRQNEDK